MTFSFKGGKFNSSWLIVVGIYSVHSTEVDPIQTNLALRLSDGLSLEGLRLHGKARFVFEKLMGF